MTPEEQIKYTKAKERVQEIRAFYNHLSAYIVVIGAFAALNYYQNAWSHVWFLWAAFGWGIGVTVHGLRTYNANLLFGKDWEDRKIQEFMNEEKTKSDRWS